MKETNAKDLTTAKEIWKNVAFSNYKGTKEHLEQYVSFYKKLLNIFQAGNYYYLLFDTYNGEISKIDRNVTEVLGYDAALVNVKLIIDCMHPDDKSYFLSFEQAVTSFFNGIPTSEYNYYKVQYDIRLKHADGSYRRILFQYLIANYDELNIYHTFNIHTDITHIKKEGMPSFSIIGLEGRPTYHNTQDGILCKSKNLLTRRELQILKEIMEGNSSKQIAYSLHLSIYTVNAHKRNIMKKAGVHSSLELIRKAMKENWI